LDPEFPSHLGSIDILLLSNLSIEIYTNEPIIYIRLLAIPTSSNCSMVPIIGLSLRNNLTGIRNTLIRIIVFPKKWVNNFQIYFNFSTATDLSVYNKQINDKERVHAAMGNTQIRRLILHCLVGY